MDTDSLLLLHIVIDRIYHRLKRALSLSEGQTTATTLVVSYSNTWSHFQQNPSYNQNNSAGKGPNWEQNKQNRENKKQARSALKEQVARFTQNQPPKADKKGKGKEKAAPKVANLMA